MAAQQKGTELNPEDESENAALEKEEYVQYLADLAEEEIDEKHPLSYNGMNLCELAAENTLSKRLCRLF